MVAMVAARTPSTIPGTSSFTGNRIKWRTRNNNTFLQSSRRNSFQAVKAEIKYVDGDEAKNLVTGENYTVVDVRDKTQYDRARIVPSTHIPLFILNDDTDLGTWVKRAAHNGFSGLFYGVAFTKPNTNFVADVQKSFSKDSKLLLVCQEGLRSGTAAKLLDDAGFQNLACVDSGLQKVKPDTFPSEGPKALPDAGKAGLVTIQSQFSAVLGTVLVCAYLFLKLFPDQAEQLFFKN